MAKVIDNVSVPGDDYMPRWVILNAAEYADRQGMAEITVTEYFATDEYQRQARRNVTAAERVAESDALANS